MFRFLPEELRPKIKPLPDKTLDEIKEDIKSNHNFNY